MADFKRPVPQVPVVLAALIMWASFAWGLPAEAGEGDAEPPAEDRWAGVRISDAYDYARCTRCGEKNEVGAERCSRCGCELPQPSAEMTHPDVVFVPGRGYYREGTLLEPGKSRKGLWIPGMVMSALGLLLVIDNDAPHYGKWRQKAGFGMVAVGAVLLVVGFTTGPKPVYALESGERYEPFDGGAYARRSADSGAAALKIEVTLLSF